MRNPGDAWFIYSRSAGRISAGPANVKGWLALLMLIITTVALGHGVMLLTSSLHPFLRLLALSAVVLAGVLPIVRLALLKGRQVT